MSLLHSPHNSLKGKTIESFKSNGKYKGYTLVCTDGSKFEITGFGYPANIAVSKLMK